MTAHERRWAMHKAAAERRARRNEAIICAAKAAGKCFMAGAGAVLTWMLIIGWMVMLQ